MKDAVVYDAERRTLYAIFEISPERWSMLSQEKRRDMLQRHMNATAKTFDRYVAEHAK